MKIYENDSYMRQMTTVVEACRETEDGRWEIRLRDTIFFPEGGGQHADTGILKQGDRQVRLVDGQENRGEIRYTVDGPLQVGESVDGILDWEQRFDRLQQHTGEHIFTGTIHNRYGFDNVGFHLSDDGPVTLDMNGELTPEQVLEIEAEANAVIYRNLPVLVTYPSREELKTMTYRSKIEIEGQVRIVTIGEAADPIDVCACCAPHLNRTGEVGLIKVIYVQRYKGGVRIGILCGRRAMEHYDREWDRMNQIGRFLSTGPENILNILQQQRQEIADLKRDLSLQAEKQLMARIHNLADAEHLLLISEDELTPAAFKNGFNAMASRCAGFAGLFVGNDAEGYRFYAGSTSLDSGELASYLREKLGARGGGSREMIQGKISADAQRIEAVWAGLASGR